MPRYLRVRSAAQNSQDIVAAGLRVELLEESCLARRDFRPEDGVHQVLGAQVLDGFLGRSLEICRSDDEFVLRGNKNAEGFAVAHHVEYVLRDNGRLADHADARGPLGEDESLYVVILLNHAAVGRSGGRLQLDRGIEAVNAARGLVIAFDELWRGRFQRDRDFCFLDDRRMPHGITAAARQSCQRHPNHPDFCPYGQCFAP